MIKFAVLALAAAVVPAAAIPAAAWAADDSATVRSEASAPMQVKPGKMLYTSNGYRLASVYILASDGSPEVILDGKMVTIPLSSLSDFAGKLTTSLTKKDIAKAQ